MKQQRCFWTLAKAIYEKNSNKKTFTSIWISRTYIQRWNLSHNPPVKDAISKIFCIQRRTAVQHTWDPYNATTECWNFLDVQQTEMLAPTLTRAQQPHKTNHWELSSCVECEWKRRYDYKCVLCVECLKIVFLTIQRWTCISAHTTHYTPDDGASALNISAIKSTLITASVWESYFNILCLVNN